MRSRAIYTAFKALSTALAPGLSNLEIDQASPLALPVFAGQLDQIPHQGITRQGVDEDLLAGRLFPADQPHPLQHGQVVDHSGLQQGAVHFRQGYLALVGELLEELLVQVSQLAGQGDFDLEGFLDRKSTRLNSSHGTLSRMPSSA